MTIRVKQSTASQEIPLGVFVDETDGKTAETGLTIANTDIKLWKMGATSLANKNSGGATHIAGGIYYAVLDDTDTNTLGALVIFVHVAGALPIRVECEVLAANVYDSLIAASDKLQVDAVEISGDSTAADNLESYTDGTTPMPVNAMQISGDAGAADNAESFFDGTGYAGTNNVIPTVTSLTNAPSDSSGVTTLLSRLSATRAGYLDNLSAGAVALEASVQAVLSKLLKYVQLIVRKDSAIATDNATELTAINADGGSGAGAFVNTTDSQEALRDRGDSAWITATGFSTHSAADVWAVATRALTDKAGFSLSAAGIQAIWDALTSALTAANSIGKLLVDNINATISSRLASASYTAPDNASITAIKAKTDNLPASPAATGDIPTAAEVADTVWEEAIADHSGTAGSTAEQLAAAGAGGDPWATVLPGSYTTGQAGKILGDNLNATVSSRASQSSVDTIDDFLDTEVAAIKAKTDNLPADPADASDIAAAFAAVNSTLSAIAGYIDTEVAASKVKTDQLTFTIANKLDVSLQAAGDLAAAVANKIADHVWRRNYANIRASSNGDSLAFRSPLGAVAKLVNKWSFSGADLQITHEDDSTVFGAQAATTNPSGEPITSLDTSD